MTKVETYKGNSCDVGTWQDASPAGCCDTVQPAELNQPLFRIHESRRTECCAVYEYGKSVGRYSLPSAGRSRAVTQTRMIIIFLCFIWLSYLTNYFDTLWKKCLETVSLKETAPQSAKPLVGQTGSEGWTFAQLLQITKFISGFLVFANLRRHFPLLAAPKRCTVEPLMAITKNYYFMATLGLLLDPIEINLWHDLQSVAVIKSVRFFRSESYHAFVAQHRAIQVC